MTDEGKLYASSGELENARRNLAAADLMLTVPDAKIAVTQVYYACFHAMRAMLYSIDVEPTTHRGTHNMFSLHFVKTGLFEPRVSKLGSDLQKVREQADYAPRFEITVEAVTADLAVVRAFVDDVAARLGQ